MTMPNDLDGIYKIYTDALNTASELTKITGRRLNYEELKQAETCNKTLQIFRKYGSLQLGADVLKKHGQEYKERLNNAISRSQRNLDALNSEIGKTASELDSVNKDLEMIANGSAYTSQKGSIRKDPKLNEKRLLAKKSDLQSKLDDLNNQKSRQKLILGTNSRLLTAYDRTNNNADAFFGAILDGLTDTETRLAEFAEDLLQSVPDIGGYLTLPNRWTVNRPLIINGLYNSKKIDLDLLNFMIAYIEHPEMEAQFSEIDSRVVPDRRLKTVKDFIDSYQNTYSFGTNKYPNVNEDTDKIDFAQMATRIFDHFKDCFPRQIGYYTGENLPMKKIIMRQKSTPEFSTYQSFYKQLSIDLAFKITEYLLKSLEHIDKHTSGKIWDTPADGLARQMGHHVEYIEPKSEQEINFLSNIYLHEKYDKLHSLLSKRLIEMKTILSKLTNRVYDEQHGYDIQVDQLPDTFAVLIESDEESYRGFTQCLDGLFQDIKNFEIENPQLASDLLNIYTPLLDMIKLKISDLQKPLGEETLEHVTYPELVSLEERSTQICKQTINAYGSNHLEILNGLMMYYKKFLELAASLDEIEVSKLKESIQEDYNIPYQPLANIGIIEYYYRGYRHINFDMQSKAAESLGDAQRKEHDEWVTAHERLCTIQKLVEFIRKRENGPVILSSELTSQLEQDLVSLMNNQIIPTGEIKM